MRGRIGAFIVVGLLIAAALAFFVSPDASSKPDGLAKVAADTGIDGAQADHALGDSPTAGYEVKGVDDPRLSKGVAGLIGVGACFALAGGAAVVLRRRSTPAGPS